MPNFRNLRLFTAMKIKITVFREVTPSSFVDRYRRFSRLHYICLQKFLHCITFRNIITFIEIFREYHSNSARPNACRIGILSLYLYFIRSYTPSVAKQIIQLPNIYIYIYIYIYHRVKYIYIYITLWRSIPMGSRSFTLTLRHTKIDRAPLDE